MSFLPKEHGAYGQITFPLIAAFGVAGMSIGGLLDAGGRVAPDDTDRGDFGVGEHHRGLNSGTMIRSNQGRPFTPGGALSRIYD